MELPFPSHRFRKDSENNTQPPMDLFQDFSFSKPAQHYQSNIDDIEPAIDASPRSSRSASPFSTSSANLSPTQSIMDLSRTSEPFPPYDLDLPPSHAYPSSPISSRLPGIEKRRRSAQVYFDTVRQRRQSAVRLQCNPKNAASIRNYVERFLSRAENQSGGRHPSMTEQYIAPPTSAPMQELEPMESSSEEEEVEAFKTLSIAERPSSSDRRTSGSTTPGRRKSYAVQKSSKGRVKSSSRF